MHILTRALRMSDETVHQGLDNLRAHGCVLDEHPEDGVRLLHIGLGCWTDLLEAEVGWPYQRFEIYKQTASTQEICKRYARQQNEASIGTVAIADEQTQGRGRLGRAWSAPPGSALLFSFVGHPSLTHERLSHIVACDLLEGLSQASGLGDRLTLKWPNDILIEGKKLAGILIERINELPVIGIGINTHTRPEQFPAVLREKSTSIACHTDPPERIAILWHVLRTLAHNCYYRTEVPDDQRWEKVNDIWRKHCGMINHSYRFLSDGIEYTGKCLDVDIATGLTIRLTTGEVVHLPAATTSVVG